MQSLQGVLGVPWGLLLVEHTQNALSKRHPTQMPKSYQLASFEV